MENKKGQLVVAFAGYQQEMEEIMNYNVGLPSRFPYQFTFDDFSDKQLLIIAHSQLVKRGERAKEALRIEGGSAGKYMRVAIRRLGRGRERKGFGNARAVENLLEQINGRFAERLRREKQRNQALLNCFYIRKEDVIGPRPNRHVLEKCDAYQQLQKMTGLQKVKDAIDGIAALLSENYELELRGQAPRDISLNRGLYR